jgi:hypothetical protein
MSIDLNSEDIPTDRTLKLKGDHTIWGNIPAHARLEISGNVTISGNIGAGARIWSNGAVHAQNIGAEADVTGYSVVANEVKKRARVTSTKGSITLKHASEGAILTSGFDLSFQEADRFITAYASNQLNFDYTKDGCDLTAGTIHGTGIGKHCILHSTYGSIELVNVKGHCQLNSSHSVRVEKNIGPNVLVYYREDMRVPKNRALGVRTASAVRDIGCGIEQNTANDTHMIPLNVIIHPIHQDLVYVIRDLERAGAKVEYKTMVGESIPSHLDNMKSLHIRPRKNISTADREHVSQMIHDRLCRYVDALDARVNDRSLER